MAFAPSTLPALIHPHAHCDNGLYPSANFYAATTSALNHIVAYRRKPLFQMTTPLRTAGSTGYSWRGYFRTGYGAKKVTIVALMAEDDRVIAVDPYVSVVLTKVGGAALTAQEFHYGASAVASVDDPDSLALFIRSIDVDPASEYTLAATINDNARVMSLEVHEDEILTVSDSNAYFSEYMPAAGSPIFDNRVGQQLEAVSNLIRYNSGGRIDWMRDDGTARTRTSATPINLIDNSSASPPTVASPGFTVYTTARNTYAVTTVPIKLAVYGSIGAGSGKVYLRDTGGTDVAQVTINGAAGWYTATGYLPVGSAQKLDLMFAGDGANTVSVYAVSLYEDG